MGLLIDQSLRCRSGCQSQNGRTACSALLVLLVLGTCLGNAQSAWFFSSRSSGEDGQTIKTRSPRFELVPPSVATEGRGTQRPNHHAIDSPLRSSEHSQRTVRNSFAWSGLLRALHAQVGARIPTTVEFPFEKAASKSFSHSRAFLSM